MHEPIFPFFFGFFDAVVSCIQMENVMYVHMKKCNYLHACFSGTGKANKEQMLTSSSKIFFSASTVYAL